MRSRDFERRQQVEERKRHLFEVEREKREAILKKNQVMENRNYIRFLYAYIYLRTRLLGTRGQNRVKKKK